LPNISNLLREAFFELPLDRKLGVLSLDNSQLAHDLRAEAITIIKDLGNRRDPNLKEALAKALMQSPHLSTEDSEYINATFKNLKIPLIQAQLEKFTGMSNDQAVQLRKDAIGGIPNCVNRSLQPYLASSVVLSLYGLSPKESLPIFNELIQVLSDREIIRSHPTIIEDTTSTYLSTFQPYSSDYTVALAKIIKEYALDLGQRLSSEFDVTRTTKNIARGLNLAIRDLERDPQDTRSELPLFGDYANKALNKRSSWLDTQVSNLKTSRSTGIPADGVSIIVSRLLDSVFGDQTLIMARYNQ
jgi:hypothetical protein